MRAVQCCNGGVQVADVSTPSGEGVRVRVRSAGICSSDLHMLELGLLSGVTPGHEIAGLLDDGRAVALEPIAPCGHCDMCIENRYELCRRGPEMIYGVMRDGGMAEEIVVPERCIVPLPSGVSAEIACLAEPLAVAFHGVNMLDLRSGSKVAVIGAGVIGLAATAILAHRGFEVHLAARHDAQREAGLRLGAVLDPEQEYHAIIECAGSSLALAQAARLCRPGGSIVLLATYWEAVELPATEVCMKNLRIFASSLYSEHGGTREIELATRVLADMPRLAETLITHRFPLEAAAEAFGTAADRAAGAIKVVLEP